MAVHKNTRECTFECAGAGKQTAEKVGFFHLSHTKLLTSKTYKLKQLEKVGFCHLSHTKLLTSKTYKLKQLLSYFTHKMTSLIVLAPFRVAVLASCGSAKFTHDAILSNKQGRGSHANAFYHSLLMMGVPEGNLTNLYLSISTITVPSWRRGFLS